jgi:hypothetical protein
MFWQEELLVGEGLEGAFGQVLLVVTLVPWLEKVEPQELFALTQ